MAVTFAEAKAITAAWLAERQRAATLTGKGRENAEYWDVGWDCPPLESVPGDPEVLVSKTTGEIAYKCAQLDADRAYLRAMTPVVG
jgi:hypothetical protein